MLPTDYARQFIDEFEGSPGVEFELLIYVGDKVMLEIFQYHDDDPDRRPDIIKVKGKQIKEMYEILGTIIKELGDV